MRNITVVLLIFLSTVLTIAQASGEAPAKDEGANRVLTFPVGAASFGMKPVDIVSALKAEGYTITRGETADNQSNAFWELTKGASPGDRAKVKLTAKNGVATSLVMTFVSGSGGSYDMNAGQTSDRAF